MATSILSWEIPRTEEHGIQSTGPLPLCACSSLCQDQTAFPRARVSSLASFPSSLRVLFSVTFPQQTWSFLDICLFFSALSFYLLAFNMIARYCWGVFGDLGRWKFHFSPGEGHNSVGYPAWGLVVSSHLLWKGLIHPARMAHRLVLPRSFSGSGCAHVPMQESRAEHQPST